MNYIIVYTLYYIILYLKTLFYFYYNTSVLVKLPQSPPPLKVCKRSKMAAIEEPAIGFQYFSISYLATREEVVPFANL